MFKVEDIKPRGGLVVNIKPNLSQVENIIPKLTRVYGESIRWASAGRGMPIGLLLTLTYPNDMRL